MTMCRGYADGKLVFEELIDSENPDKCPTPQDLASRHIRQLVGRGRELRIEVEVLGGESPKKIVWTTTALLESCCPKSSNA